MGVAWLVTVRGPHTLCVHSWGANKATNTQCFERALAARFARPGAIHSEGEAPLSPSAGGSALSRSASGSS